MVATTVMTAQGEGEEALCKVPEPPLLPEGSPPTQRRPLLLRLLRQLTTCISNNSSRSLIV